MDWFLYDNGLCHERVKTNPSELIDLAKFEDDPLPILLLLSLSILFPNNGKFLLTSRTHFLLILRL